MSPRHSAFVAAVLAALSALSTRFADVPIARWVASLPAGVHRAFRDGTAALDHLSGKELGDACLGLTLLGAALIVRLRPGWRPLARLFVLVALSNMLAHLVAGVLKPPFGRLRPFEIAEAGWVNRFFAGGSSFPSGHAAFYWGTFAPLFRALPRWRFALLVPPLFVALARVLVNDHFAGDVLAGVAIALGVSGALTAWFERVGWLARSTSRARAPEPGSGVER